jgi:hypothetical protein
MSDQNPFLTPPLSFIPRTDSSLWGLDDPSTSVVLDESLKDAQTLYETFLSRKAIHPDWLESLMVGNRYIDIEADVPVVARTYRIDRDADAFEKALRSSEAREALLLLGDRRVITENELQGWRDLGERHPLGAWAENFLLDLMDEDIATETLDPLFVIKVGQTEQAAALEKSILVEAERHMPRDAQTGIYLYGIPEHTMAFEAMLEAILESDADAFVRQAAVLVLSFGVSQVEAKRGFIEAFTTLFDTGTFPSEGVFQKYLHFIARCGIFH